MAEYKQIGGTPEDWEDNEVLLSEPARRTPLSGIRWISDAFTLLGCYPGSWLRIGILLLVVNMLLAGMLSVLGAGALLLFVIAMVWLVVAWTGLNHCASRVEYEGEPPTIGALFEPVFGRMFDLLLLIVYLLIYAIALYWVLVSTASAVGWLPLEEMQDTPQQKAQWMEQFKFMQLMHIHLLLFGAVLWFAPVLTFLQEESPFSAVWLGLLAFLKNILPFILFFAAFALLNYLLRWAVQSVDVPILRIGAATLYLSFMQVVTALCCYASYRDIWFEE